MVGILVSYWGGLFSGAMLVSGRVFILESQVNAHIFQDSNKQYGWKIIWMFRGDIHSKYTRKFHTDPETMMVGRRSFPFGFQPIFKGKHVIVLGKVIHHIAISKSPKRVGVLLVSVQSTSHPRGPFFDWTDLHGWSLPKQPQTKYINNLLRSSPTITTNYHIPSSYISFMS